MPQHIAVYPGSFDPVTFGHLDVIRRGRRLFDRVVVGVGRHPGKDPLFTFDERVGMIRTLVDEIVRGEPELAAVEVRAFAGLTVDFAREVGEEILRGGSRGGTPGPPPGPPPVPPVLLRGIRNLSDLQSEVQQALTNRQVAGLETVFVVAGQDFAYTSSSLIKQITALGDDPELSALKSMVPPLVIAELKKKKSQRPAALERLRMEDGAG